MLKPQTDQHSLQITHMGVSPDMSQDKTTLMEQEKQVHYECDSQGLYSKLIGLIMVNC